MLVDLIAISPMCRPADTARRAQRGRDKTMRMYYPMASTGSSSWTASALPLASVFSYFQGLSKID